MRVFDIILTKLALDKLRYEQQLEEAINSDLPQGEKEEVVDDLLEKLAINGIKIKTWMEYLPQPQEVDNDEEKTEQDGTVQQNEGTS